MRLAVAIFWVLGGAMIVILLVFSSPLAGPVSDALGLPTPSPFYVCGAGHPTPTGCSIDFVRPNHAP